MAGYAPPAINYTSPNAAGADNPYAAKFAEQQAKLNLSLEQGLAADKQAAENTEAGYKIGLFENAQTEGRALKAGGQKANTEGLAESGVLAQRQGVTQTGYAQKAGKLGESRQKAIEGYQTKALNAEQDYNLNTANNVRAAVTEAEKYAIEHPPAPEAAAAAPAVPPVVGAVSRTGAAATAGAPRVVGIKAQPTTGGPKPRVTAIQKIKNRAVV